MSGPERIWWISIILASVILLFVRCIHATEIHNDVSPPTQPTSSPADVGKNGNFEMVDMSHHHHQEREGNNNNNLHTQTGQTTRIVTSGEVDENFWLKHLGEDFKHAIHLQVGDNSYDGVHNISDDGGSHYDAKHDNRIKEIPVDSNRGEMQNNLNKQHQGNPANTDGSNSVDKITNFNSDKTTERTHDYDDMYTVAERRRPLVKKHSALEKRHRVHQHVKYIHPKKMQNINFRHAHKIHQHQHKTHSSHSQQQNNEKHHHDHREDYDASEQERDNNTSAQHASPIVVTLPMDGKTVYQLEEDETPVVVKMPPVIYHQEPTYSYASEETTTNHSTTQRQHSDQQYQQQQHLQQPIQHNQYASHQTQQSLQYENTDFTQYNPMSPHTSVNNSPHPHHSAYSAPMMQIPSHSPYYTSNPAMLNDPSLYHTDPMYTASSSSSLSSSSSDVNSHKIPSLKEQLHKSTDSVHFILRKPSIPYNGQVSHNRIPVENSF